MDKYNIEILKKIKEKTGLSLFECKKVLFESNFDILLAIKNSFFFKKKKYDHKKLLKTIKGKIISGVSNDFKYGILLEINSETDFVSKNNEFDDFCKKIINYSILNKIKDFNIIKKKFYIERLNLISKFNENISFSNKYYIFNGELIYSYIHREKIGVLINSSEKSNLDILKKISMHIIFNKPEYISSKDIPNDLINNECKIQSEILKLNKKENMIFNQSLNNKIKEFIYNKTLLNQKFILNNNKYVKNILYENKINLFNFKLIELL